MYSFFLDFYLFSVATKSWESLLVLLLLLSLSTDKKGHQEKEVLSTAVPLSSPEETAHCGTLAPIEVDNQESA